MRTVGAFRTPSGTSQGTGVQVAIKKGPKMIDELIRKRAGGLGFKTIAADLGISKNTVKSRLKEIGGFEVADAQTLLSDGINIKQKIFTPHWGDKVDWPRVLAEVEGGVPIKEYWEELGGSDQRDLHFIPYESFWREFRRRYPSLDVYYHKTHEPGQRCEIDYKGDSPGLGYIDRATGEFIECRLFGMVLCNSRMFFPYATVDEKQGSWLSGIRGGFEYFGGVTATLVVDNAKTAVTRADWFDPDLRAQFGLGEFPRLQAITSVSSRSGNRISKVIA